MHVSVGALRDREAWGNLNELSTVPKPLRWWSVPSVTHSAGARGLPSKSIWFSISQCKPYDTQRVKFASVVSHRIKVVVASLLEGCRPPDGVHTLCTPALPPAAPQPDTFTDTCRCFTSRWRQGMAWPRWSAEQDGGRAHRKYCSAAPSSRRLRRPAESEEDIFWSLRTPTDD